MTVRRWMTTAGLTAGLVLATSAGAWAAPDKACWGVATAGAAQVGFMGPHASEQEEPRAGLGNLARELGFDHISDLGAFLADVDGIPGNEC